MRHYSFALVGLLALGGAAFAQQKAPPPPTAGTPEQLNAHLAKWETEMSAVKSISAECSRTDVNRVRNVTTQLTGEVKCLKVEAPGGKVDKLALLRLVPKDNPEAYEKFICTGELLYQFSPREKTIYVHKLAGQVSDDNFLGFLFQMKAEALKKRYDLTLVFPKGPDDPTLQHYVYIDIKPRLEADKADFQRARLVLFKASYLPAQLWFEEPNGNHHTWELSKVKANDPGVKPAEFVAPEKPAGWQVKEVKRSETESRPRVIRPSGP
jgi:TIGR03009 family protein